MTVLFVSKPLNDWAHCGCLSDIYLANCEVYKRLFFASLVWSSSWQVSDSTYYSFGHKSTFCCRLFMKYFLPYIIKTKWNTSYLKFVTMLLSLITYIMYRVAQNKIPHQTVCNISAFWFQKFLKLLNPDTSVNLYTYSFLHTRWLSLIFQQRMQIFVWDFM